MKISVPVTEAARLLELCDLHFVSASTLFPDYSGAAKAVKDDLNKIIFNNLKNEYDLGTNNQSVIYSEKLYQ